MKPVFIPDPDIHVYVHNGNMIALLGLSSRREPRELYWWGYSLQGDIVVLHIALPDRVVDCAEQQINRPCHRHIVPEVEALMFAAGKVLGYTFAKHPSNPYAGNRSELLQPLAV